MQTGSDCDVIDREIIEIIWLTLRMTTASTLIATVIGVLAGLWLERVHFRGKRLIVSINRTLMGVPPVVVGLVVYLLLMRNGFFGMFRLLFTLEAMIIAQVLIISPIICGIVHTAAENRATHIRAFAMTMGANPWQTQKLLIKELSNDIYFAVVSGFGRAMSEVGAILIVGGNIRHQTRTMTTAISLLRNRGDFEQAIILGIILMGIVFLTQTAANLLRKKERQHNENY